jgi:hypothetical protein
MITAGQAGNKQIVDFNHINSIIPSLAEGFLFLLPYLANWQKDKIIKL